MDISERRSPVYFGPIDVKEIKTFLSASKPKVNNRHTISDLKPSRIVFEDSPTMECNRHFVNDEEDDVEVSFTSEYLTAQETLNSDKDCEIIECDTSQSSSCQIVSVNNSSNDLCSEKLNNTLEEIERLLNNSVETVEETSVANSSEGIICSTNESYDSVDVFHFKSPITPVSKLPVRKQEFKAPFDVPLVSKSPKFKNVVSPVAMYIKNSPKVPLVQHVPMRTLTTLPCRKVKNKTETKNQEFVLPPVVYRPAKQVLLSKEKEIKLPKSLAKYVPDTPAVIIHEGRINKRVVATEKLLLEQDLTLINSALEDSTLDTDVSLITIKNPYQ